MDEWSTDLCGKSVFWISWIRTQKLMAGNFWWPKAEIRNRDLGNDKSQIPTTDPWPPNPNPQTPNPKPKHQTPNPKPQTCLFKGTWREGPCGFCPFDFQNIENWKSKIHNRDFQCLIPQELKITNLQSQSSIFVSKKQKIEKQFSIFRKSKIKNWKWPGGGFHFLFLRKRKTKR